MRVKSRFNYLAEMPERPYYLMYEPPEGNLSRNTSGNPRTVPVHDARELDPAPGLDREGFVLVAQPSAVSDFRNEESIRVRYYPETTAMVKAVTGAVRVLAFDHNLRSDSLDDLREKGFHPPVRFAHNDYTEKSGPQRVRDLLPDEADDLLRRRFAIINVWRPVGHPVEKAPLAVCDARTIGPQDLVETDLRYRDRTGEIYSMRYNTGHRWFYYPRMRPDEAILLKCYDSDPSRARFTAHSAFDDPTSPADATPRESIEVRTIAFFRETAAA